MLAMRMSWTTVNINILANNIIYVIELNNS